jgi:hypothetical protein
MDLLAIEEDLDPELSRCMIDDPDFGSSIKHPLVFSILHNPKMNAMFNAMLRQKKEAVQRAVEKENWDSYVWLHERAYRLDAFLDIRDSIAKPEDYWSLLGSIWLDSENIWQNLDEWRLLFEFPERGCMEHFMEEGDRQVFNIAENKGGMPPTFQIYRGFNTDGGEDGFSWTLDRARAKWFARRYAHKDCMPMVAVGTVGRKDVIGYMTGRDEQEIVVLPENVYGIEITEAPVPEDGQHGPG